MGSHTQARYADVIGDFITIDFNGSADFCVPHHFLLHGNRGLQGVQPRAIGVRESVRSNVPDASGL